VIWNFVSGNLPTVDDLFHEKSFVLVEIIFFRSKFVKNWPQKNHLITINPTNIWGSHNALGEPAPTLVPW
jgi:hypothetical protein